MRQDENTSGRFNIVVVMEDYGIKSHPISKFIENASELDTVFLFFESKLSLLPLYCSHIIDIFDYESAWYMIRRIRCIRNTLSMRV